MIDRYSRQVLFSGIGHVGQEKLGRSFAVIAGCGALGAVIATAIVRAGVGKVRIIDRDFIELHNLQRQILFDEDDVRNEIPKAVAAERHLRKINSSIEIEGIVADINYTNVERFVAGAHIILDGLDSFETRFLINDVSLKHKIPFVYGGTIGASGMTMNIIPGETACLRCPHPEVPTGGRLETCETAGIIVSAPLAIGSIQVAEAIKILTGSGNVNRDLISINLWSSRFSKFALGRRADCPSCHGVYQFLEGDFSTKTTSLCGQNAVQVLNPQVKKVAFDRLAAQVASIGEATYNEFMFRLKVDGHEMVVFPDGRAIVKNTTDESLARSLYAKYIGV